MTEGTLSAEELDRLEGRAETEQGNDQLGWMRVPCVDILALITAARELSALKHDIGRHMGALLAAEEALHKEREACAKVADRHANVEGAMARTARRDGNRIVAEQAAIAAVCARDIATSIRSRTQETSNG